MKKTIALILARGGMNPIFDSNFIITSIYSI
jgi:hypothetical protein